MREGGEECVILFIIRIPVVAVFRVFSVGMNSRLDGWISNNTGGPNESMDKKIEGHRVYIECRLERQALKKRGHGRKHFARWQDDDIILCRMLSCARSCLFWMPH